MSYKAAFWSLSATFAAAAVAVGIAVYEAPYPVAYYADKVFNQGGGVAALQQQLDDALREPDFGEASLKFEKFEQVAALNNPANLMVRGKKIGSKASMAAIEKDFWKNTAQKFLLSIFAKDRPVADALFQHDVSFQSFMQQYDVNFSDLHLPDGRVVTEENWEQIVQPLRVKQAQQTLNELAADMLNVFGKVIIGDSDYQLKVLMKMERFVGELEKANINVEDLKQPPGLSFDNSSLREVVRMGLVTRAQLTLNDFFYFSYKIENEEKCFAKIARIASDLRRAKARPDMLTFPLGAESVEDMLNAWFAQPAPPPTQPVPTY